MAKVDAPAPLTERERWLLDRMEELEKRVAELESKGSPVAGVYAPQPDSANATPSPVVEAARGLTAEATSATSDSLSHDRVTAVGPQATEKGKSGAAKPEKADPFAFADVSR